MENTQELHRIDGLVRNIDSHHGLMGGAICLVIVALVAWIALKEIVGMSLSMFGRTA